MKVLKYLVIVLAIVIPSLLTVLIYNDKITQNSPVYYKQGVDFYNKGDYSNAFYNFSKIKWISPLYPMALYKQAKSAQKLGDYNTATIKYELFLEKNPTSVFATPSRFNLAKSYYYLKKYPEAKHNFLILKEQQKDKPSVEDYYLGILTKKEDKQVAAKYFRNYIKGVLSDEITDKNYLIASLEELETLGINLTMQDRALIGEAYYENNKYSKALEYFSKLPLSSYWDYLVIVNHYAGNKVVAKKLIENGIKTYSKLADEERLNKVYDIYTSYMQGSKVRNWTQMLKIVQTNSLKGEDYVMYKLANILPSSKALNYYSQIETKYPQSAYAPESLWNVFWSKYKLKDYAAAEKLAIKHIKQYQNVNSTTRMIFWFAKTEQKMNKTAYANNIFSKLAAKYPDDYYGLRAEAILEKKTDFWTLDTTNKITYKDDKDFPINSSNLDIKDLKLINTIFALGDYEIWADADLNNKIVESWFEQKKGKKSRSMVLARDTINKLQIKPPFFSPAYKLAYPLYWIEEINLASNKFKLDPWLIISLIREESYFDENAKSRTNALGLMQLMPGTANFIVSKYNIKLPTAQDLTNPRVNLYLGCTYLKYLNERFNNPIHIIAAYNGGEGSVNKWIKTNKNQDNDEFIENITFEETRNYVKKIFRTYHLYQKIYK